MQPARRAAFALAISVVTSAATASGHIDLLEPEPRAHGTAARGDTDIDVNSNLKNAPCGQITTERTDRVTTYAPGQRITLRVREENAHVSYLRVRIDLDGADFPLRTEAPAAPETQEDALAAELALGAEGLLAVVREDNDTAGFVHELELTLPNETCRDCTLQVAQFMYDDPAAPHYFQCADLVIADAPAAGDAGRAPEGDEANGTGANGSGTSGPDNVGPGVPLDPEAVGPGSSNDDPAAGASEMSANSATTNGAATNGAATNGAASDGATPGGLQARDGALASAGEETGTGCTLAPETRRTPRTACIVLAVLGLACARRRARAAALDAGLGREGSY